jgi:flagellar hook-associated protein 1 FlgK
MGMGVLDTAVSGLLAFQQSLATTSHNIANVNTEGYSRQRAEMATLPEMQIGQSYFVGNGVKVASIGRMYDKFLLSQLNSSTAAAAHLNVYNQMTSEVDNFIADADASLPAGMQKFFSTIHDMVNDPTSITVRQTVLTSARTLVERFNSISSRLDEIRSKTDRAMQDSIAEINVLTSNIASLNLRVVDASRAGSGAAPNDLLDQRDLAVRKLAEQLDIQVIADERGNYNVMTSSGQSLVLGEAASELLLTDARFPGGPKEVLMKASGSQATINITDQVSGGELGGYRQFIDDVLNPVQNDLGRIAIAFAHQFNEQLQAGFDLNGSAGVAMFNEPPMTVIPSTGNTGSLTAPQPVAISDYAALTGSDYRITVGAGGTVVSNLRTQQVSQFAPPGNLLFSLDGIDYDLTGAAVGDSFLLQPTRSVASSLELEMDVINDAARIAAAGGASGPAVGDNANALLLADLQLATGSLKQGSYQDAYNEVVGRVGVLTQSSSTDATAQKKLLEAVVQQRENISGVNLDEEAANLINFQQAYQASAQVIAVVRTTFDSLIAAVQ